MKNAILIFILFCIMGYSVDAQLRSARDLLGKWQSEGVSLQFTAEGKMTALLPGGSLPARYETNFSSSPYQIRVTLLNAKQLVVYQARFSFTDNEHLLFRNDDADNLPFLVNGSRLFTKIH